MKKELNIAEILKDKQKGTKLYADAFGELSFSNVAANKETIIYTENKEGLFYGFYDNGKYDKCGKPVLVPSEKMRDWSKFTWKKGDVLVSSDGGAEVIFDKWYDDTTYTCFYGKHYLNSENENNIIYFGAFVCTTDRYSIEKGDAAQTYINTIEERLGGKLNMGTLEIEKAQPEFKDGDIVYSEEDEEHYPSISILNLNNKDGKCYYLWYPLKRREVIIYNVPLLDDEVNRFRYATEEEKQKLFNTLSKEGKRWNAEKKIIEDIKKKKEYQFQPLEYVLSNDNEDNEWTLCQFSHFDKKGNTVFVGGSYADKGKVILPYEGNEHLLGTTKDVEE